MENPKKDLQIVFEQNAYKILQFIILVVIKKLTEEITQYSGTSFKDIKVRTFKLKKSMVMIYDCAFKPCIFSIS